MSKNARSFTVAVIVVVVVAAVAFGGGQWLWHKLLVMHGMAH
jgi:hypothetical protein